MILNDERDGICGVNVSDESLFRPPLRGAHSEEMAVVKLVLLADFLVTPYLAGLGNPRERVPPSDARTVRILLI